MKQQYRISSVFGHVAMAVLLSAHAAGQESPLRSRGVEVQWLSSRSFQIAESREHIINDISRLLEESTDTDSITGRAHFQNLARTVGTLHHDDASAVLIKYIVVRGAFGRGGLPIETYPCAYELSRLGSVAYPAIFHKLSGECSEKELKLLANVIVLIDGSDLGRSRLEIALRKSRDARGNRERSDDRRSDVFHTNAKRIMSWIADPTFVLREIEE